MSKQVIGCEHCGKTKTTLYKVGEHRYCKKCVPIIKAIEEADEKERRKNADG